MRSDMRWLLLLTAIIGIVGCADALKATSLIFGRVPNANKTTTSATTTTTSTVATVDADHLNDEEKKGDGEQTEEEATKPPLTGIPQIDYIWDPNLPRELNGYNLSTYPFLNSVPDNEDIDFKCDGLHDGFYASIKYSCQLYHHCVYGIRHDFLCANFTAFDQKSFICHFVSEVNCKSSPKYWFRNDALYKATTTTSTTTTTVAPPPTTSQAPERPLRRPDARRPLRRRRPQHEYYYDDEDYDDDYVEERMNRRRKTNRNRNRRPEYDDEYDSPRGSYKDDEDDYSYEQRSSYRHRNRNRDSDDDFEYDRRSYRNRKRPAENKRHYDNDRRVDDTDERRPHSDGRKYQHDPVDGGKRKHSDRRQPLNEDDRRGPVDEGRRIVHDKRRPNADRRPQYDDEYDDVPKKPNNRDEDEYDDRTYGKRPNHESKPEIVPKVRTSNAAASIYNRPRAPPKINRPVPNNEKKKYEYTPQKSEKATTPLPPTDEELYDEYDYEAEKAPPEIKHEPADKKGYAAPSSQRDQRPSKIELMKEEKLPASFNADELDDEDFGNKQKVTSIKPQRSTLPRVEAPVQHQHHQQQPQQPASIKTEYYEKPKEVAVKSNPRPALDFNKDEYIPDSDLADYPDEETEDRLTKEEEEVRRPEVTPTRTEFRPNSPAVLEHHTKVPVPIAMPRPLKEQEVNLPKVPYAAAQPQDDYKTKIHRLSPTSNVRTPADGFPKSNTEPEERDVYTILSKDTISSIREPSGFKPVSYNEQPHELDFDSPKNRPYVRVMKRPFLPSRGGSPYLPRGLKPVGAGITTAEYTTEGSHVNTKQPAAIISSVQFNSFRSNVPISRTNPNNPYAQQPLPMQMNPAHIQSNLPTTTHHPQIESPRSPLDEIFNSDYDVTLNDALNPTLKPLSQSHEAPIGFSLNKYDRANPYARSDVSHSSSQYRATAIPIPIHSRQATQMPQQQQQQQQQPQQQQQQQMHHQPQTLPSQQQLGVQTQQQSQQQRQPQQSQQSQYYDDEYDY